MTGFDSKRKAALDEEGMYLVHPLVAALDEEGMYLVHPLVFSDFVPPQPAQEPVEDVMLYHDDGTRIVRIAPQRTWVGLTDEEANLLWENTNDRDSWELIKRVEAKLKEKNNG